MSQSEPVLVIAGQPSEIFPGLDLPIPAAVPWPTRREAIRAAVAVACFVGVPALAAVGVVLALFALSAAVLLAPVVAAALTWAAWHFNRVHAESRSGIGPPEGGTVGR